MQNKSFNNSDIFIAVNDANQRSHQEIEFVTWIFYSHLMYVSDTFQTPFVGIRSVCAVLLFDKNMQDRKYLHTVSWIGQYPCIRMNESMLVYKQSKSLPIVTCVFVWARSLFVWKMKESSSNPQLPNPYTSFLQHFYQSYHHILLSCIFIFSTKSSTSSFLQSHPLDYLWNNL